MAQLARLVFALLYLVAGTVALFAGVDKVAVFGLLILANIWLAANSLERL